jgi:hypothetical protein
MNNNFEKFSVNILGEGALGGKASGLLLIKEIIKNKISKSKYENLEICVPNFIVLRTDVFDNFVKRNNLIEKALTLEDDKSIALQFQKGTLPVEIVGELRTLVQNFNTPLAIRSSSMLEDSMEEPFAGVYETKMIANNSPSIDERYKILSEAIKFVYSSMFFKTAKNYFRAIKRNIEDEKMAVVIQEVAGKKHYDRFYPEISGVARSYNYYPSGRSKHDEGVVNLALGLGKTIVDGGISWDYSPSYPKISPPFAGTNDILKNTQTKFWTVNMGPIHIYDPIKETEYMNELSILEADYDGMLKYIASTYNPSSDRIIIGTGSDGPRIINFAPLLQFDDFNFNNFIKEILNVCKNEVKSPVEIEFAMTYEKDIEKMKFHFLQLRPMYVSRDIIDITDEELYLKDNLLASDKVLGNGLSDDIWDIVFVKKDIFDSSKTRQVAVEIEGINKNLLDDSKKAVFIGFGRWGSSEPWLGIPVNWGQISSAGTIIELTLPDMNVTLSQGSHFFHNLTSLKVSYFSIQHDGSFNVDWDWLNKQKIITETSLVKHVRLKEPLIIMVDGRTGRGVIKK